MESTADEKSLRCAEEEAEWLRDVLDDEELDDGGAEFGGLGGGNIVPVFPDVEEPCSWWDGGGVMLGVLSLLIIGVCDWGTRAVTCGFSVTFILFFEN